MGEVWVDKREGVGTQGHVAFILGSEVKKEETLNVYLSMECVWD